MFPSSNDKAVWGPKFWGVLESIASQFPDNPTPADTKRFSNTVKGVASYVPCEDCTKNSQTYFTEKPPEPKNRESAVRYMCEFRNSANSHAGSPLVDCDTVVAEKMADSSQTCSNCSVEDSESKGLTRGQRSLARSKAAKRDLFYSYCADDNLDRPELIHAPCPSVPETSCVDYKDQKNIKVYLNPYTDSDRQVLHEYQHYKHMRNGGGVSTEDQAQDFAYQELNILAPRLLPPNYKASSDSILVASDGTKNWLSLEKADLKRAGLDKAERSITDEHKNIEKEIADIDRIAGRRKGKKYVSFEEEFPMYSMMLEEERRKKLEEEKKKEESRGSLSVLDPIYESFGKAMGFHNVPPHLLNLAYTPEIIENVVMTLAEANMTSAGAGILSASLGAAFFLGGVIGRKKLATNDQLLLQNLAGSFFWRTMEFLNPKRKMKESVMEVVDEFKKGHYSPRVFLETPEHELGAKGRQTTTGAAAAPPPTVVGGTAVDANGNPIVIPGSTDIGVTDTSIPAQYDLDGDNYYDDTDAYEIDRDPGTYIQPSARNIYNAVPDTSAASEGDLVVDSSASYAAADDDFDMYD
jgi:hypothetical protein